MVLLRIATSCLGSDYPVTLSVVFIDKVGLKPVSKAPPPSVLRRLERASKSRRFVAGAASGVLILQVGRTPLVAGVCNRSKPDYGLALPKTAARSLLTWSAVTAGAAAPQLLRT